MKRILAALALSFLASAAHAAPCGGSTVTGGTPVQAIPAGTFLQGFMIINISTTDVIWFNAEGGAAAAGTVGSIPLPAGAATTYSNVGGFATPLWWHPNAGLSVVGATTGDKWTCEYN